MPAKCISRSEAETQWIKRTTQLPNDVVDSLLDVVSLPELKVLVYIIRRTYGFQKPYQFEPIAYSQFQWGVTRSSGEQLDHGTGLSRQAVYDALKSLTECGLIECRPG